jgi:hypothetical protein
MSSCRIAWLLKGLSFSLLMCSYSTLAAISKAEEKNQSIDSIYSIAGEELLDRIIADFYNGQFSLYAETIDRSGNQLQTVSYVWPASHLLRAFKNAYRLNPDKYLSRLRNYSISLDKYLSDAFGKLGYAAYPGEEFRFYDDNGLLIIQFAEIFRLLEDERILARAKWAYDFCNNDRDVHWGLPQHESELGQGMFYSMAVNQTGLGAALLYEITEEPVYLEEALAYYEQLTNPEVLLMDPAWNLFHQYTFFQQDKWSLSGTLDGQPKNGSGFRAYQTSHVIQLAIKLHKFTGAQEYMDDAVLMTEKALSHWYRENQGLNEIAFWGGDDMIDALLDMYAYTGDPDYLNISRDIVDYLIEYGQDSLGYFPGDYNDALGKWNLDRRGMEPASVLMMGQAAAASAMLRIAVAIEDGRVSGFDRNAGNPEDHMYQISVSKDYLTDNILLRFQETFTGDLRIKLFTSDGKMVQEEYFSGLYDCIDLIFRHKSHQPGIYLVAVILEDSIITKKIIL